MTLAQTRSVLETRMAVSGHSVDEHNEILGLDAALKYINATLVNRYVRENGKHLNQFYIIKIVASV